MHVYTRSRHSVPPGTYAKCSQAVFVLLQKHVIMEDNIFIAKGKDVGPGIKQFIFAYSTSQKDIHSFSHFIS